jgi:hypothetical protein
MPIIRIQKNKNNPYFLINRETVCDDRLSWKATGLLAYFLSLPDDWEIHFAEILPHKQDGKAALRSAFSELIRLGYMTRSAQRNGKGKILDWNYTVFESPLQDNPLTDFRKVDTQPLTGFQEVENRTPLINNVLPINDKDNRHQQEIQGIYDVLKDDFHQDTPTTREIVQGLIEKYGAGSTREAMKRAVIQGVAKLSYVLGILNNGLNTPKKTKDQSNGKDSEWRVR